jgi:hypothetical protein
VYQEKHRYLALGIEISNEAEERSKSRIKVIASLLKQQSLLLDFVGVVIGLLRLRFGTHTVHAIKI